MIVSRYYKITISFFVYFWYVEFKLYTLKNVKKNVKKNVLKNVKKNVLKYALKYALKYRIKLYVYYCN